MPRPKADSPYFQLPNHTSLVQTRSREAPTWPPVLVLVGCAGRAAGGPTGLGRRGLVEPRAPGFQGEGGWGWGWDSHLPS